MLLGPLEDLIKRSQDKGSRPSMVKKGMPGASVNPNDKPREKILRKDLQKIGLLGCGGFGAVELYEHKKTGETYAMKGLSKGYIVKTGMQDTVIPDGACSRWRALCHLQQKRFPWVRQACQVLCSRHHLCLRALP